jgi:ATP adenylyltransferase
MKTKLALALSLFCGVLFSSRSAAPPAFEPGCFYCTRDAGLTRLMIEVGQLPHSTVYLLRNQFFPGRCVVAYRDHRRELYALTAAERAAYMDEVAEVARAVAELFHADKMNYGIFGDEVSHLHVHLAPKVRGTAAWGKSFPTQEEQAPVLLTPEEYEQRRQALRTRLAGLIGPPH